uniref:J domain-containing protein n=1 Tax=Trypanosoma congolense (strain IL3000) TaxID=1068625 RepID=G0USM7_TRYCI|nr:conserved hypothetical protein [Trypanosoma congolense IL3000]
MSIPLAVLTILGGAYYLVRLAPRVSQHVSIAQNTVLAGHRRPRPYHRYEGGFAKPMTRKEALLLLGFTEDVAASGACSPPSESEIKVRYYALMKELHTDVDGSLYIAAKLNEARDILRRQ